ncbi:MAG: formamidopyrimidine-DNA glycosylase [Candidatus Lokiarchaeota archaeon]|nr:formamidopyrimidine-DNA glycosylase [Candidatus Lokiarchaeota archaeon]
MPELPDVEIFRKRARKALNKKIKTVNIKQKKILKTSESTLRKHLNGNKFTGTSRHGKYLFMKINDGYLLALHFGMTGEISYYKKEKPKHIVLEMEVGDKYNFAVISIRKLGEIDITDNLKKFLKNKNLGKDALSINKKQFLKLTEKSKGSIKTFLMDQSKIAGIGNIYTDEILFQLGIHPKKKVEDLEEKELEKLFEKMKNVLKEAIKHSAIREKMPRNYLIKKRADLAHNKEKADKCPKCGGKIKNITVGGRSAYFCSKHQK